MIEVSPIAASSPPARIPLQSIKVGDNITLLDGAPNVLRLCSDINHKVENGTVFTVKELAQGYYDIYGKFLRTNNSDSKEHYLLESIKSKRRRFGLGSSKQITSIWVPVNQVRVRFNIVIASSLRSSQ